MSAPGRPHPVSLALVLVCTLVLLGAAAPAADPQALHEEARAALARHQSERAQALLEQIVEQHDGTAQAVAAAHDLLRLLLERWLRPDASPQETIDAYEALGRGARLILQSRSARLPEAAQLRGAAYRFVADQVKQDHTGWLRFRDPDPAAQRRTERERMRRCAEQFLELLGWLPPGDDNIPDALAVAARCHDNADAWSEGARLHRRILAEFPRHPNAQTSLAALVRGSMAGARYEEAAGLAEQYAARYPRDRESPEMLALAHTLRLGFGHVELARAALDRHERTYRRGRSSQAAEFLRARLERSQDGSEQFALLRTYLEQYAELLAPDERVVAEARLAQLQWRAACKDELHFDLCIRFHIRFNTWFGDPEPVSLAQRLEAAKLMSSRLPELQSSTPSRCTLRRRPVARLVDARDRKLAAAAQRQFEAVRAAAGAIELSELDAERREAVADAGAMAAVYAADLRFEELLATELPAGLRFAFAEPPAGARAPQRSAYLKQMRARESSLRRFETYLARTDALARALEQQYEQVVASGGSVRWTIAALARIAHVSDLRADVMYASDLPEGLVRPADIAVYCDLARAHAEPLYERALAAYARCVELAVATGVFTEFAESCEMALTGRAPAQFPPLSEALGQPGYTASRPDAIGLQSDPGPGFE